MKTSILEDSRIELDEIATKNGLLNAPVSVLVKTLTPEEAIGVPGRRDFPIILGKERVVEAESIRTLKKLEIEKIGVSHCTGMKAAFRLHQEFGDRFFYGSVGSVFEV